MSLPMCASAALKGKCRPRFRRYGSLSRYEKPGSFAVGRLEDRHFKNRANFLSLSLKVFQTLADNLNNGGLQTVPTDKASVTAS